MRFLKSLGPGLVTGAADDDPSGVATYSIVGAQFGTSMLWMAWLSWPLMAAIQMMCARIGMVTGEGLATSLRKKMPKWVVIGFAVALFIANTINIAADLSGMADAAQLLSGVNASIFVVIFGFGILFALIKFHYASIANVLKWLALSLFAYVVTAFLVHPDWSLIADQTFTITMPKGRETWQMVVAILGTTISPYLFFWQTAQEVEEEKKAGNIALSSRQGTTKPALVDRMMDVGTGTLLSNLVMFFIMLTAALTLHKNGITHIETSKQVAEALRPLAGNLCTILYTVGIIAVGLLAIPTLAGSSAYAFAETFDWKQGLNQKLRQARAFYAIIVCSTIGGIALNFLHISPVKALLWSAIVNGVVAPFILVGVLLIATDKVVMRAQPSSKLSIGVVIIATVLMFAAGVAMFAL